jgi:hypothetical protein
MTTANLDMSLWEKIAELASRWMRRHDRDQLATAYDSQRAEHAAQADQLAAQVDPALFADVVRTRTLAAAARQALAELETNAQLDPGAAGLTYAEQQARVALRKAARQQLDAADQARRAAEKACDVAEAALDAAINTLVAPIRTAAVRAVPEAERAAQQLVRDARERARWAGCLTGSVRERVVHRQERAE